MTEPVAKYIPADIEAWQDSARIRAAQLLHTIRSNEPRLKPGQVAEAAHLIAEALRAVGIEVTSA